ncbi:MAG: YciI family protein [Blastocatellia bacterium]
MKSSVKILMPLLLLAITAVAQTVKSDQAKPPQFDLDTYQLGLLRKGPNHGTGTKEESDKAQAGHMANINKMAAMGKLMAAGPMGDNGDLRGIFLFKAASLDEAKALAAEDPAIKAGRLRMDIFTWYGPKNIGKEFIAKYQADPKTPATMTKYFLVLLNKGAKADEGSATDKQKLQTEHMWNVRRRLDDKSFATAGPFSDGGNLRGIFVIAAKTAEEAKAIADADPSVKAGALSVEIHPWWVAKEVWP